MLSKGEAAAILSLINSHHGNARWDDLQLEAFYAELRADMTQAEAREAVKRFYAANDSGRWCGSGDVNAIVRRMRNESKPSEAQIGRESERLGLDDDQSWMYRRQRMLGNGQAQARQQSLSTRNPLELAATKPRKRSMAAHSTGASRLGMASLGSILGGA